MPTLELEITDKMMAKLEERAEVYAVTPSDVAKSIISSALASREKPCWIDKLTAVVGRISDAVIAVSKMEAEKGEHQ